MQSEAERIAAGLSEAAQAAAVEGYRDGLDRANPEPGPNRSHVYRHCFAVGRADRDGKPAFGSAENARRLCEIAEAQDAR